MTAPAMLIAMTMEVMSGVMSAERAMLGLRGSREE